MKNTLQPPAFPQDGTGLHKVALLLGLAALLASTLLAPGALATGVTTAEARQAATNQIKALIAERGAWGRHPQAWVTSVEPLMRRNLRVAYVCHIAPAGYIVVSSLRELAPIRAYSFHSRLEVSRNSPLVQLVRDWNGDVFDGLAARLGRPFDLQEDLHDLVPAEFAQRWVALLDPSYAPPPAARPDRARGIDYQEGDSLLTTTWSQVPPYNDMCPDLGCDWPDYDYYNTNGLVGCVATAGAQICRYWNWPQTGTGTGYDYEYDWPHMGLTYAYSAGSGNMLIGWEDGWHVASQEDIDAVALISRRVGASVSMSYGCDASGTPTENLQSGLPNHFRFSDAATVIYRDDYDYAEWIHHLQTQLNDNRPLVYRIDGHAIVCDGWDEVEGSYYIHIVYGWNGSNDGWFHPGEIPGGGPADEHYAVIWLLPDHSISQFLGDYPPPDYPYWMLTGDTQGIEAEVPGGYNFQILREGLEIRAVGASPDLSLRFRGEPGAETSFYFCGDPDGKTVIRIKDGMIKMNSVEVKIVFY